MSDSNPTKVSTDLYSNYTVPENEMIQSMSKGMNQAGHIQDNVYNEIATFSK